jgi:kynureninase
MTAITRADCLAADRADALAAFRRRFRLPRGVTYLDGNSLGALPAATAPRVRAVIETEWGRDLIRSWNRHGWVTLPGRLGDKIARLIGAAPGEVVVTDSVSVNLFKLLAAALGLRPGRRVILSDRSNFPTDLYIAQGLARLLDDRAEMRVVEEAEIAASMGTDTAVVMLTQVDYRSGRLHDLTGLTRRARAAGALILWDLAHSAGALPLDLNKADVDLAVGCGYKYLNGGPGAPAFLFVARRHQALLAPALTGWFGHAEPFAFDSKYRPAPGIARLLCGTPPVLGMAALEVGVDLSLEADLASVRAKSIALTERFIALVEQWCPGHFDLVSPRDPDQRGSQVSLAHPAGYAIVQALIARGIIPDFRAPDILRFGFAPLYTRHIDVWNAVRHLRAVMDGNEWDRPEHHRRQMVT